MTIRDGVIYPPARYPAGENPFRGRSTAPAPLPAYDADRLPALVADNHPLWVALFDRAWQIAFSNLRQPEPQSGFVASFIDTAFNDNTFMWDSCFMTMFGRYARRLFDFMGTLDNFYAKQHADGFMCREINTFTGRDVFTPQDPSSTGPPIMAWTEWAHYTLSGDLARLRDAFPALVAYHLWWRDWRTWPDGSYFTTGWGSGMDNQTRVPDSQHHHRHYTWVDATMQQALNARTLIQIGQALGRDEFEADLAAEFERLAVLVNEKLWDEASGFYTDRAPDGTLSPVKSIGAYWGLLAGVVPDDRAAQLIAHLSDPAQFNRPHRVPSQPADSLGYDAETGAYWRGGVWSPTNMMILRALTGRGEDALAYDIARNHVHNVAQVFEQTGTLWENYAPERPAPGQPARPDFVGWTGLSAIAIPLEYLIGLRPDAGGESLLWDVRLVERHGTRRYPLGAATLDLLCDARPDELAPPRLTVSADRPFTLRVRWAGGAQTWAITPGEHVLSAGG